MMKLVIWDVQHGSAAYLKTPSDKHIVVDLGAGNYSESDEAFSPLLYLRDNYGIKQLDQVIITHPHTDHIDDIMNFDALSPRVLSRPNHLTEETVRNANPGKDKQKLDKYFEIDKRYSYPVSSNEDPKRPENNGGVQIQIFISSECGTSEINNHSIVSVIQYQGVKILLPGDNESGSWKMLLEKPEFVRAIANTNIFIASHHGRESGYCAELFRHFKPQLTIISDGPVQGTSVTEKYSQHTTGVPVYSRSGGTRTRRDRKCLTTRKDGTIIITVDDGGYIEATIE